jgi:hypothetical protein
MTARFTIGSVSLILCAALVAAFWTTTDESPGTPTSSAPASLVKVDYTLDVGQWHAEFGKDPKAAFGKYNGKVVELTGEVEWVSEDPSQQVGCVYLRVEGAPLQDRCATIDKQPWLKVSPGSKVRIRGKMPEYGLPRDLEEAEIVEAGPNPALVMSAQQLTTEYAADRKAGNDKFDEKWAILEGEVVEKGPAKDCAVQLKLKGTDDVTVRCGFGDRNKKPLDAVKVGSRVKVFGQLSIWKENEIVVNSGILAAPR